MILMEEIGKNGERFTQEIYNMCKFHGMSHIDAVLLFCEENEMDVHDVVPLLGSTLKEKIKIDAQQRKKLEKDRNISKLF